jgi:hypothetical protein
MFPALLARPFTFSALYSTPTLRVGGFCSAPKFGLFVLCIRVFLTFDLEIPSVELTS